MTPLAKPVTGDVHSYHLIVSSLDDCLQELETYANLLNGPQVERLTNLLSGFDNAFQRHLNISEVDRQYELFLRMQDQVIDQAGNLLASAGLRDIGTVTSALSNLISLFLRAKKELSQLKAEADLKDAVLTAIKELPEHAQARFFARLDELSEPS